MKRKEISPEELAEALHILSVASPDDAEDAFEDVLFEHKTFFLTKVPFSKLFHSKLLKLKRFEEAKNMLHFEEGEKVNQVDFSIEFASSDNVKNTFSDFNKNQNKIKQKLSLAQSYDGVAFYVHQLLGNYKQYAKCWQNDWGEEDGRKIKMSVEPDAMRLIVAIEEFNSNDLTTFEEIKQLESDNLLKQEAFRLSLWYKFEENV